MEKILLIDGNSIFYRSFYALPLLKSEYGYSNAVYGFANMMLKAVELLRNAPPKVQRVAALKLLLALEQKSFEGVEI